MNLAKHILLITLVSFCGLNAQDNKKGDFTYYDADKFTREMYKDGKPTGKEDVLGIKVSITRDNVFNKLTLLFFNSDRKLEKEVYDLEKTKDGERIFPSITSESRGNYFSSYDGTFNPGYHLLIQKGSTFFVLYIKDSQIKARFKFTNVKISKKK